MNVFWDGFAILSKKCVRGPPQGVHGPTFCGLAKRFFFECFCFRSFVSLGAQRFHYGSDFGFFLGAVGLLKNR